LSKNIAFIIIIKDQTFFHYQLIVLKLPFY